MSTVVTIIEDDDDSRLCKPRPGDVRKDPGKCVISNLVREIYPWAKSVTAGKQTVKMYDYRCPHNPEGKISTCHTCGRKCLTWATPLVWAKAIKAFDEGEDPVFGRVELRMNEAVVVHPKQNLAKKAASSKKYREEKAAGTRVPNKQSGRAKARAKSNRRKG